MNDDYTIAQLPSGFWCVWYRNIWIDASLKSKEAAEEFVKAHEKSVNNGRDNMPGGRHRRPPERS